MRFDLLIKGGTVIDPASGRNEAADVAIADGRIAAVDSAIPGEAAARVIDASGRLVTPGLVDMHTHVFGGATFWGIDANAHASRSGVTSWVDAGSAGAFTFDAFRELVVERAHVRIRAFLNISTVGLVAQNRELVDLVNCDADLFARVVERHRDLIVGAKVRMGTPTVGHNGIEPMRIALQAAQRVGLPLMVHIAFAPPSVDDVLSLMRPGDILTHCFTGTTMRITDGGGRLRGSASAARERGVVFDLAHGAGSFAWSTAEPLIAAGVYPDVISTDLHQLSAYGPMFDLPTCMSKCLALGIPLDEVVRATTQRPAELLNLDAGTLRPGARADLAVLSIERGRFPFFDSHLEERVAPMLLEPRLTVVAGTVLDPVALPEPAPWVGLTDAQRRWLTSVPPDREAVRVRPGAQVLTQSDHFGQAFPRTMPPT